MPKEANSVCDEHYTQTAAEYGCSTGCFQDHCAVPWTYVHQLRSLLSTSPDSDPITSHPNLIPQEGLRAAKLPQSIINIQEQVNHSEIAVQALIGEDEDEDHPCRADLVWQASSVSHLKLPCDEIDLGSDVMTDLAEYLRQIEATTSVDLSREWIPIVSLDESRDEGLSFPPICEKIRQLLLRELDRESAVDESAEDRILQDTPPFALDAIPGQPLRLGHQITPPLSPIYGPEDVFIPGPAACKIDLVPDPGGPTNHEDRVQAYLAEDQLSYEPLTDHFEFELNGIESDLEPALLPIEKAEDMKLDVPLTSEQSDIFEPAGALKIDDAWLQDQKRSPYPEPVADSSGELNGLLEASQARARLAVTSERLDVTDGLLRLAVPILDFNVPEPDWQTNVSTAYAHFNFLQTKAGSCFDLPSSKPRQSHDCLRWNPVPRRKLHFCIADEAFPLSEASREYLVAEPPSDPSSIAGLPEARQLMCLRDSYDAIQELEHLEESLPSPLEEKQGSRYASSRFFSNDTASSRGIAQKPINVPSLGDPSVRTNASVEESRLPPASPSGSFKYTRPQHLKRKRPGSKCSPGLPDIGDGAATGHLLGAFLQLRGQKRLQQIKSKDGDAPIIHDDIGSVPHSSKVEMLPASHPEFSLPDRRATFTIAFELDRPLLRLIESSWGQNFLIDRDYTNTSSDSWPSQGRTVPENGSLAIFQDADIILTPTVGIIITTLLQAKQQPLPMSHSSTSLRGKIENVSSKYETLHVLVSENNTSGEFTAPMISSDAISYADFVHFTIALPTECITTFIPGARETLSKYILALMSRYSSAALPGGAFLSPEVHPWEEFLRRAGMNITAAQVLCGHLLSGNRHCGITGFLSMPTQQKLHTFGDIVGRRAIIRVSQALGRRWS